MGSSPSQYIVRPSSPLSALLTSTPPKRNSSLPIPAPPERNVTNRQTVLPTPLLPDALPQPHHHGSHQDKGRIHHRREPRRRLQQIILPVLSTGQTTALPERRKVLRHRARPSRRRLRNPVHSRRHHGPAHRAQHIHRQEAHWW